MLIDTGDVHLMYQIAMALLVTHFIGDFVLQSHWMASNKSKRIDALLLHVGIYSVTISLLPVIFWIFGMISIKNGLIFTGGNALIHLITDFITSKISSKLWTEQKWHYFFTMIGFDQLLHTITLLLTMTWLIDTIIDNPSIVFNLQ